MSSEQETPAKKRNWWVLGPFLAIILGLNFWYDYYRPLGIVYDAVILIVLAIMWASKKE